MQSLSETGFVYPVTLGTDESDETLNAIILKYCVLPLLDHTPPIPARLQHSSGPPF